MGRDLFDYSFREYAKRWMFKHPTPEDFLQFAKMLPQQKLNNYLFKNKNNYKLILSIMPFIEENDLLDLHKDIEKSQIINERLLDQIKFKNKDLKTVKPPFKMIL